MASSRRRVSSISFAWISTSADWPWKPPEGWWISSRALGSASRLPSAPPITISEPADMATPKQMVCTSGATYCIVS